VSQLTTHILEVKGLTKTFAGQRALDDVSVTVAAGEIHALVGMNGSGKSTFVKVLAGFHEPDPSDALSVNFCGEPVGLHDHSWTRAFHVIHQDLALIPTMNVLENIAIGSGFLTDRTGRIRWKAEKARARRSLERLGLEIDPELPISRLSRAEATMVAMARALDGWAEEEPGLLVLDEPTAALSGPEVDQVIEAMRSVRDRGAGVLFVSHRLDEIFRVADRVTILRDGRVVQSAPVASFDYDGLVHAIAGEESERMYKPAGGTSNVLLSARNLRGRRVQDLSLGLREGEILGIAGLRGSGREDVAGLLFGCERKVSGSMTLAGRALRFPIDMRDAITGGLALVPADRLQAGGLPKLSMRENIVISELKSLAPRIRLVRTRERTDVARWMKDVGIAPHAPERPMEQFSGGNQQKAVIARALRTRPRVLLLDEPTQGVDIHAKVAIHSLLARTTEQGMGILVCSSELDELIRLCNRVLVLREGRVWAELADAELTEHALIAAIG
jgi:ribose transport system ATP-binding protein